VPDDAVKGGHLREDLFYRLNVFHIHLPPLRERKEDIQAIAEALIMDMNRKHDAHVVDLSEEVIAAFQRFEWPGNIRELRNVLERAVILTREGTVQMSALPVNLQTKAPLAAAAGANMAFPPQPIPPDTDSIQLPIGTTVEEAEKGLILRTLEHTRNNKTRAAEILGISLKTLHNKLKEYGKDV
jgi:DNA-binding NtrC family response regulator